MSETQNTYQPGWGEQRAKSRESHHHHSSAREKNRGLGGALRMRDKQAYVGLMLVLVAVLAFGAYKVVMLFMNEWRAMPHDDPATEVSVDELRIHKADEQDALLLGDSLAQELNMDSIRRQVQIETRPVYRPPRKEDEWYITSKDWKEIWNAFRREKNSK